MRKGLFAVFFLICCSSLPSQQVLNNDAIVKLVKAGLSDDLIVSTINASPGTYDTSADGLIALKQAGVCDKVVAAIVTKALAPAATPGAARAATTDDPNDPNSHHDPGVYLMTAGANGKPSMVFIDRAGAASVRTANVVGAAFSYGISKAKLKAEIPGPHATVRTNEPRPIFYIYFPSSEIVGGLGGNNIITSPTQFSLVHLEGKKDRRETAVAKVGFASAHAGVDEKMQSLFTSERLRNGVYKVTPNNSLESGEYAFIATSGTAKTVANETVVIYDFGVDLH